MTPARLRNSDPVNVTINGVCIPTTAGRLRSGEIAIAVFDVFDQWSAQRRRDVAEGRPPCTGYGTTARDRLGNPLNIQFHVA